MNILLVGTPGILVLELLKKFLANNDNIYYLIDHGELFNFEEKIQKALNINRFPENCKIIGTDITKVNCDLDQRDINYLKQCRIDVVFYCRIYDFKRKHAPEQIYKSNINGTTNLIALCNKINIHKIHQVSSAYVNENSNNLFDKTVYISENYIKQSKFPYTLSRLPIIIGNSQTGEIAELNSYYTLIITAHKIIKKFGIHTRLYAEAKRNETLNVVPIDWAVNILYKLTEKNAINDEVYITNNHSISVENILKKSFTAAGINHNMILSESVDTKNMKVPVYQQIYNKLIDVFRPYTNQKIDTSNQTLKGYLGNDYLVPPEINQEMINKIIKYAIH